MKTTLLLLALLTVQFSFSQIFSEDFQNTNGALPAGWTVIDNDGNTPDANVAQFTSAWIVAGDFDNAIDSVAMSTSWYVPAGQSDDWLITPAINLTTNNVLTFEEEAQDANFPDGYELRISTTTPTIAGFLANPALLSVAAASGAAWLTQTVDLQAAGYSNQTIYLAWRNNSTDQFVLMIDDIVISDLEQYDVAMSAPVEEYTLTPITQVTAIGTDGVITNNGFATVTNANMTVNVYDGTMANVYSGTSNTVATLAPGASSPVTAAGYVPTLTDVYTIEMISNIAEVDGDLSNDTLTFTYVVTDSTFARDNGVLVGTLGIGAGNGGVIGQQYTLVNPDYLSTISFFLNNAAGQITNDSIVATVYNMSGGLPNAVIAQTDTLVVVDLVDSLYTMPIAGGPFNLAAGDYMIAINEGDSTLTLAYTNDVVTPATTWITWPTSPLLPWANSEDFGFNVSYIIRPNLVNCIESTSTITATSCDPFVSPSGNYTWMTSGLYSDTLQNAGGCDSIISVDLTINSATSSTIAATGCTSYTSPSGNYTWTVDGQYQDTISNAVGCDSVLTINLTLSEIVNNISETACDSYTSPSGNYTWTATGTYNDTLTAAGGCDSVLIIDLTIDVLDNTTSEANNVITANEAGATYQWIDCGNGNAIIQGETSQSYMPTANGDYAVIVTSGACSDTSACTTISTIGLDETAFSQGIEIAPNPSNGEFSIAVASLPIGHLEIEIFDLRGRVIYNSFESLDNGSGTIYVDLGSVESGIYLVHIISGNQRMTERIAVSKK
ncbi:MAG: hypothetical protein Crog4KO_17940 [Crocinitomicaceae bacterium]